MFDTIEFAAVVSSAIYGIIRGLRHKLDVVGCIALAFAVAFGGGTLRDLFLDRQPLFWIANDHYPVIVFGLAILAMIVPRRFSGAEPFLAIPDALGLGLFSIVGAGYAIEAGTSWFLAAIFGVITGTFGGVIGDVICNQIPSLFRPSPLYATCSFAGAWAYLLAQQLPVGETAAAIMGIVVTVALRLMAIRWNWVLWQPKAEEGTPTASRNS